MRLLPIYLAVVSGILALDAPLAVAQEGTARTPDALVGKSIDDLSRGAIGAAVKDDIKALRRGPLLIHGNYCGIGNRPGTPPVDALDAACMRHDACTKTGKLPSCACDDRLRSEAALIARDPQTPADVQAVALATANAMAVLICKYGPPSARPTLAVQPATEAPAVVPAQGVPAQ